MLSENIKVLRKAKGMSQEELAIRLNVVRQTISKWERGASVPDSELLIKLAEVLDTSVTELLGETIEEQEEQVSLQTIAARLETLNAQFARENERRRKLWRGIFIIAAVFALGLLVHGLVSTFWAMSTSQAINGSLSIIGGADGPTAILVTGAVGEIGTILAAIVIGILAIIGIVKTSNKH